MSYITRLIDATDPTASLRHAAYLTVVAAGIGWLTWGCRKDIDANWVAAFGLLLAAVTTGKLVGAAAPSAPGSPEPDGGTHA